MCSDYGHQTPIPPLQVFCVCMCLGNLPKLTKYHFNTNPLRQQQIICQESRFVKLFVVVSILKQKMIVSNSKAKMIQTNPTCSQLLNHGRLSLNWSLKMHIQGASDSPYTLYAWIQTTVSQLDEITYHLLTESEVITGKSQTEALMYWPSDSEVDTSRPRSEISL